jgi:hypothetical protein
MTRILMTIALGAVIGLGLGGLQARFATSGYEERFAGSRATLAETRGEKTQAEMVRQSTGTPKVEVVGGNEFSFGTMQHGESMSHTFVFRNIGDGPLNLDMGASTCKCTVGELKSSILQPGEETDVTLTWNAVSISSDFGQSATIHTNAPDTPEVQLRVRGQIADSFVIEPNQLSLGELSVSEALTKTFHVFNYLKQSQELKDFAWSDEKTKDKVKIVSKPVDVDRERFPQHQNAVGAHEVQVTFEPGLSLGQINARITFATDQEDKVGTLELPVAGRVAGDVVLVGGPSFDPKLNVLRLGTVKSSEGAKVSISMAVQGNQRDNVLPQITSVTPAEALKVTVGEPKMVGSRKYFPLHFEVPKGAPETYYAGGSPKDFGKVIVTTNHEFTQEVRINIQLIVVN